MSARPASGTGPGGYRAVASGAQVDESLFGERTSKRASNSRGSDAPLAAAGAFISSSELSRIRENLTKSASVKAKKDSSDYGKVEERPPTTERTRAARERRAMMMKVDDERLKAKAMSGAAGAEEREAMRAKIAPRIKEHDKVKFMRTIEAQAEALYGRKAQIAEKERKARIEASFERKAHREAVRRAKAAEALDREAARQKAEKMAEDAAELAQQIAEREQERMLELERVHQEGLMMKAQWERQEREKREAEQERIRKAEQVRLELLEANKKALLRKEEIARAEAAADKRALKFLRAKAKKEAEHEAEVRAKKEALEKETARLRALQEKATDKKAKEDEERAKRDQEKYELAWRRDAAARAEAAVKRKQEQLAMLEQQVAMKKVLADKDAISDKKYVKKVAKEQRKQLEVQVRAEEEKAARRKRHQEELKAQIAANAAREREVINAKMEERKMTLLEQKIEEELLAEARDESVRKMRQERGVADDFLVDIMRVKPQEEVSFQTFKF